MTAINHQHVSVDVTRRVRTDKKSRLLDVGNSAKPSQRNGLAKPLTDTLGHQARHSFGVFDWPRRNGVHPYPVSSPLDREIARQSIDAGLRRRNVELHRRAE